MIQASYFFLISLKQSSFHKGVDCRQGMTLIQQLVASQFTGRSLVPARDRQVIDKSLQLFVGPLQHIQGNMKSLFVLEGCSQPDTQFRLGLISVFSLQS